MTDAMTSDDYKRDLRSANIARQKGWDAFDQLTLAYRGNELAGEVGEACNVIKKLERERLGIAGSRDTIAHLAEELADVIICTDLIAMQAGIDLDAAVVAKFNASSEKVGLKTRLADAVVKAGEVVAWADSHGLERPIDVEAMKHLRNNPTTEVYWSRFSIPLYAASPAPTAGVGSMRKGLERACSTELFRADEMEAIDAIFQQVVAYIERATSFQLNGAVRAGIQYTISPLAANLLAMRPKRLAAANQADVGVEGHAIASIEEAQLHASLGAAELT